MFIPMDNSIRNYLAKELSYLTSKHAMLLHHSNGGYGEARNIDVDK